MTVILETTEYILIEDEEGYLLILVKEVRK